MPLCSVRYRNWHLYAERGLVGQPIVVWLCGSHVLIERQDEPLSQYSIEFGADPVHPTRVFEPRFFEHRFPSPQPFLLDLTGVPWCPAYRADRCRRRHRPAIAASLELPFELPTGATA